MNSRASGSVLYRNPIFCSECKGFKLGTYDKRTQPLHDTASLETYKTTHTKILRDSFDHNKIAGKVCDPETCNENYSFKTKCYQYKALLVRVKSLLDEIQGIKNNETFGVCDFCKRYNSMASCKRCEFMAKKLGVSVLNNNEVRQQRFDMWLSKVKQLLYTILEREVCQHKSYHRDRDPKADELTNLLNQLKVPLDTRKPYICHFLCMETIENLTESKDVLEEVLSKLGTNRSLITRTSEVICTDTVKYFTGRTSKKQICIDVGEKIESDTITNRNVLGDIVNIPSAKKTAREDKLSTISHKTPTTGKSVTPKTSTQKNKSKKDGRKGDGLTRDLDKSGESNGKKGKIEKSNLASEGDFMTIMLKLNKLKKEKEVQKQPKKEKVPDLPKIMELPVPKRKKSEKTGAVPSDISESVIECEIQNDKPKVMIKDTEIEPYADQVSKTRLVPILYNVKFEYANEENNIECEITESSVSAKSKKQTENVSQSGVNKVKYMLSDKGFIEKGWTLLPTTKIMRRVNIYKMMPANSRSNWFKHHQFKGIIMYETGERFAEIDETGHGRWYYKNGKLALDYYSLQEPSSGYRYVVYSSGENDEFGRKLPVTVLASFDFLGNGVVYDHYGNERLKYNQFEGIVIDEKIGPPGRWKWHTLNDPPVLLTVQTDTQEDKYQCFKPEDNKSETSSKAKEPDLKMIAIEFDNFIKEKEHKLMQKFKPFQIKMKALKINDKFSLKILDQSSIYLMFRYGRVSVKLELGMVLISNEIIDSLNIEVLQVETPYDVRPPRSKSLADIQKLVGKAKNLGKSRFKLRS